MRDDQNLMNADAEPIPGARWVPAVVVMGALVGFITLAWYAYHAGTQAVGDGDLQVVEADRTPIKEKPADPGGMQFPNQDKTIFDTFSGKAQTPPRVERVLPAPETPLPEADNSGTGTWINDKLHKEAAQDDKGAAAPAEQVIGAAPKKVDPEPAAKSVPPQEPMLDKAGDKPVIAYVAPQESKTAEAKSKEAFSPPPTVKPAPAVKPAPVVKPVVAEKPKPAAEKPKAAASSGSVMVQLGAYRSEKEAQDDWDKIQDKFSELADMSPTIVKADLGAKGIYYRLRTGGFANTAQAKALCGKLSAQGQGCLLPAAK